MSFVCVEEQTDGYGSQFQNYISAMVYAELNKCEYVHFPIHQMEHNYDNEPGFVQRINEHMNIDKKYRLITDIKEGEIRHKPKGTFKQYFDQNFEKCYNSKTMEEIRVKYMENKPPTETILEKDVVHISVHIRRPNSHDCRGSPSYDKQYIELIKKLNAKCLSQKIKHHFHIMSQGTPEGFKHFTDLCENMTLHLNEAPEVALHRMVISNVLMTNASSYSYVAALLSRGLIYFKTFWHTGSKNWIHF